MRNNLIAIYEAIALELYNTQEIFEYCENDKGFRKPGEKWIIDRIQEEKPNDTLTGESLEKAVYEYGETSRKQGFVRGFTEAMLILTKGDLL